MRILYVLIILTALVIPALAMELKITEKPINQADAKAAYMIVNKIIVEDTTIRGDLYDAEGTLITTGRVYAYAGGYKNIPFRDLLRSEIAYLSGEKPDNSWLVATIKLWLDDQQTLAEDGAVSKEDPYFYDEKITVEDLLELTYDKETE